MIYFIGEEESIGREGAKAGRSTRAFKIGYTSSHTSAGRLAGLQTGNPRKLKLYREVEGTLREEKQLHVMLKNYRLAGEWFLLSPALVRALRSDCASIDDLMERAGSAYIEGWRDFAWFAYPEHRPPPLPAPTPLTEEQNRKQQRFLEETYAYRSAPSHYAWPRRP